VPLLSLESAYRRTLVVITLNYSDRRAYSTCRFVVVMLQTKTLYKEQEHKSRGFRVEPISRLRSVTCHMKSHSVTATRHMDVRNMFLFMFFNFFNVLFFVFENFFNVFKMFFCVF